MKRFTISMLVTIAVLWGGYFAAQAHAATWPAQCHTMRCVNRHLNDLDQRQATASQRVARLQSQVADLTDRVYALETRSQRQANQLSCIGSLKFWQQYTYSGNGSFFTYLDLVSDRGDGTFNGPWFMLVDTCGIY